MRNTSKVIVGMASAAMLALLGLGGAARTAAAAGDNADKADKAEASGSTVHATAKGKRGHMTATVSAVDRVGHNISLMNDSGERMNVHAPSSLKGFDTLKEGDRIAVTYQESIAVALTMPSEAKAASAKGAAGSGGTACEGSVQTTANVVSVDPDKGELTFRGAGGQVRTVRAADPVIEEKLGALHPGDLIQVTFTEPVAAHITPVADSK